MLPHSEEVWVQLLLRSLPPFLLLQPHRLLRVENEIWGAETDTRKQIRYDDIVLTWLLLIWCLLTLVSGGVWLVPVVERVLGGRGGAGRHGSGGGGTEMFPAEGAPLFVGDEAGLAEVDGLEHGLHRVLVLEDVGAVSVGGEDIGSGVEQVGEGLAGYHTTVLGVSLDEGTQKRVVNFGFTFIIIVLMVTAQRESFIYRHCTMGKIGTVFKIFIWTS